MSAAYFQAAIPEPFRILGLKLKPFSLGHYFLLQRFGNGFVGDKSTYATRQDLIFGVLVCCMAGDQFQQFTEQEDFEEQIKNWAREVGLFDVAAKAREFKAYLDAAQQIPKFWIEQEPDAPGGGHWSQALITTLMGQLGYSREQALNAPLAQALADFYKYAESLGSIRLMTDEEVAEAAALEAAAAAAATAPNLQPATCNLQPDNGS